MEAVVWKSAFGCDKMIKESDGFWDKECKQVNGSHLWKYGLKREK